jgi:hypothetical protein
MNGSYAMHRLGINRNWNRRDWVVIGIVTATEIATVIVADRVASEALRVPVV